GFKRPLAICETSRGCPYRCLFCSVWVFYRGRYRKKSPERVLREIASIRAPYVLFTDDNFLQDVERGYVLAELLRTSGEKKRFIAQLRSDTVVEHKDLIKLWRECGLEGVFIGFEKIKDEDLRTINKRNSVKNNEIALDVLRTLKIDVWSSFIVDPSFEKRDFEELLSYVREKIIKNPTFSILTPLPGTELFQRMKAHLTTHDPRFFDIAHVVLPTRLNLREFYEEFCRLYRKSYSAPSLIREGILCLMRHINSLPDLMRMLYNAYRLTRPIFYLRLHESAAGRTINRRNTL
ncbi:MAG: radical SAM protein, partial [Candidatus Bathyarchaeia archaeon]